MMFFFKMNGILSLRTVEVGDHYSISNHPVDAPHTISCSRKQNKNSCIISAVPQTPPHHGLPANLYPRDGQGSVAGHYQVAESAGKRNTHLRSQKIRANQYDPDCIPAGHADPDGGDKEVRFPSQPRRPRAILPSGARHGERGRGYCKDAATDPVYLSPANGHQHLQ